MADCTYSVVDLSKKKKNRSLQDNNVGLEPGTYSVLEQRNFDSEGQDSPQASTTEAFSNAVYEMPSSSTRDTEGTHTIVASAASNEKKRNIKSDGKQTRKFAFCIAVTVIVLLLFELAIFACLAVLFAEVSKLKLEASLGSKQEQTASNEQPNEMLHNQLSHLNKSFSVYKELIGQQLREHHENQTSTTQMQSSLLRASLDNTTITLENQIARLKTTVEQQHQILQQSLPSSCAALPPSSPSGYYWVRTTNGSAEYVYCNMTGLRPLFPASSCAALPPSSPSGYYWVRTTNGSAEYVYCNMTGLRPLFPASSCAALPPSSPSGYYWVRALNDSAVRVYCDMTRSCGGVTGGWMRVAELDMTNSSHQCPSALAERVYNTNIRTCASIQHSSSVIYSTMNIHTYSRVCGKIIAYQYGTTDAFHSYSTRNIGIDGCYVDGVSLTHGRNSRQHIWTFAAAYSENTRFTSSSCRCFDESAPNSPRFVSNDYFCDTGVRDFERITFYSNNPLWDGAGCELPNCCSFNTPPWFHKQLPRPTTDDIEMRVCRDESSTNEDIAIQIVELYVHQ